VRNETLSALGLHEKWRVNDSLNNPIVLVLLPQKAFSIKTTLLVVTHGKTKISHSSESYMPEYDF
jgi:hypothetical protein